MATQFCKLAGIDLPIVAFSHCRDVVVAVSRAGGLGVLGAAKFTPEDLETELSWIDSHIEGRPYGVDVLAPRSTTGNEETMDLVALKKAIPEQHKAFVESLAINNNVPPPTKGAIPAEFGGMIVSRTTLEKHVDIALSHPIKLLVSALGPFSPDTVDRAHKKNMLIGGMCGSPKHALIHASKGADVIIAQGTEAGGHTGDISTLVLTPQVVDAVAPIPVLAAGGIASGRQIAAALALGADGAWTGSLWLTSYESDTDPCVVEKLLDAKSTDTIRTKSITGKPVRVLRTPLEEAWAAPSAPPTLPAPQQGMLMRPLIQRIFQNGVTPLMGHPVGQVVGLLSDRRSCKALIEEMMSEVVDTIERVNADLDLDG